MIAQRVLDTLREHREEIQRYGVKRIGLFGSCARGEDRPDSDLDFAVELEAKSFDSYMGLQLYLEELFDKKIDLILIDSIKPRLRDRIMEELVYATGL